MKLVLGITGASGSIYAYRIIKLLSQNKDKISDLAVVFTDAAKQVWNHEIDDMPLDKIPFNVYSNDNFFVPFASGSSDYDSMVVCPCSMGTMGKIANSIADNLLTRAADVMLKENRKLVIVPREMPFNLIHLDNMKKLKLAGAEICAASPSFYSKPENITQAVDTVIQKIFQLLKIDINFFKWMENQL